MSASRCKASVPIMHQYSLSDLQCFTIWVSTSFKDLRESNDPPFFICVISCTKRERTKIFRRRYQRTVERSLVNDSEFLWHSGEISVRRLGISGCDKWRPSGPLSNRINDLFLHFESIFLRSFEQFYFISFHINLFLSLVKSESTLKKLTHLYQKTTSLLFDAVFP